MPYRVDIAQPAFDALDRLVELGALDVETVGNGIAAILPDSVGLEGLSNAVVSEAFGRDSGSVWLLNPSPIRIGGILIGWADCVELPNAVALTDSSAFGTGHHPTTALCLEAMEEIVARERPDRVLDVGTGSGILALAALKMGVPQAVGLDIDAGALQVAAKHAQMNRVEDRLLLILGGPGDVDGLFPFVAANILAAPLIGMAPVLVRRLKSRGLLMLSGVRCGLELEVRKAYQRCGIRFMESRTRDGWVALMGQASW